MKVLLVQSQSKWLRPVFPAGLARIASVIREVHQVAVFDPNIESNVKRGLVAKIRDVDPDVVGISLRNVDSIDYPGNIYFYPDFVRLVRLIRATKPNASIVVGGGGFSLFAREIMSENPQIDVGTYLEGDASFPELLGRLDRPETVKGLLLRENDKIRFTGERPPVDIEGLPRPAYDLFPLARYLNKGVGISIESKRGCRLRCAYCPYPFLNGPHVRTRRAADVVDEIEYVVSTFGARQFEFVDSVFNLPLAHAEAICEEIIARKLSIKWFCYTSPTAFTLDYARLASEAGCRDFPFSMDAFSDRALKRLQKGYTNADILETVRMASQLENIRVGYGFFLNPPGSTVGDFFRMCRFLWRAKKQLGEKMAGGRLFLFNRIRIEPHTRMQEIAVEEGLIRPAANLLRPVYYRQRATRWLERIYGLITWPIGPLVAVRRLLRAIRSCLARRAP